MKLNIINTASSPIFYSEQPIMDSSELAAQLQNFVEKPFSYRKQFLQKYFGFAFDGYSYYGQENSSNQASSDMLHSFVFSDFYDIERYPDEFQSIIKLQWPLMKQQVKAFEHAILTQLKLTDVLTQYQQSFGHMMSANFYPAINDLKQYGEDNTRLSEHPDVSLITVFPFGFDKDFQYQDLNGDWHSLPATNKCVAFLGHLTEWFTKGEYKALNHRVQLSSNRNLARTSFALFSLPFPKTQISRFANESNSREVITSEQYFQQYLSIWD
ncbi:2OG-Fe(II) oxygenase family protein [Thalassotalea crassostreae]|uniref:2OG-Fe(II) oxygenase family protein n=1 Tax=Thalassotalea crassostreae TaxID=1763536 RepID=UPI0008388D6D|nr:2OG-Fe(II) oxygenase family protein [Thalassotalea crassostreae]